MTARSFVIWITLVLPGRLFAQNVSEVQVAPPTVTVKVGERSGLLATAFDRAGNVIPTVRFIWSSNNVSVARVDNDGTVTGVAGGVAIVEARAGARKGQAAVQVIGAPAGGGQTSTQSQPPARPAEPPGGVDPFAGQPPGTGPAAVLRIEPPTVYLLPSENTRVVPRALKDDGSPEIGGSRSVRRSAAGHGPGRGAAHRAADGVLAAVRKHAGRAAGAQGRRLARGAGRRDVEVAPPRHRERRPERRDRGIVRRPGNRTGDELDRPHRHGAGGGAAK